MTANIIHTAKHTVKASVLITRTESCCCERGVIAFTRKGDAGFVSAEALTNLLPHQRSKNQNVLNRWGAVSATENRFERGGRRLKKARNTYK
jgi:hypothetical protein